MQFFLSRHRAFPFCSVRLLSSCFRFIYSSDSSVIKHQPIIYHPEQDPAGQSSASLHRFVHSSTCLRDSRADAHFYLDIKSLLLLPHLSDSRQMDPQDRISTARRTQPTASSRFTAVKRTDDRPEVVVTSPSPEPGSTPESNDTR
jgi:hypothetical protein